MDDTCDLADYLVDLILGRFCNQQLDSPDLGNRAGNSNHQPRFRPTRRLNAIRRPSDFALFEGNDSFR